MNPEKKAEDDITTAYVRILNINNELNNSKSGQNFDRQDKID
jgi:DNA-directed RNA polymerase beta' subunit